MASREPQIIVLQITIEKSWWMLTSSLISLFQTALIWRLATGGCRVVEVKEAPISPEPAKGTA